MADNINTIDLANAGGGMNVIDFNPSGADFSELYEEGTEIIKSEHLPAYVDDIVYGYLYNGEFYKESTHTTIMPHVADRIYVDKTNIPSVSYRWVDDAYIVHQYPDTVRYGGSQSLTTQQKTQARSNIGAADASTVVLSVNGVTPTSGNVNITTFSDVPSVMDTYKSGTIANFLKEFSKRVHPSQGSAYLTGGITFTDLPSSFRDGSNQANCELYIYIPVASYSGSSCNIVYVLEISSTNCFTKLWYGGPGKWMAIMQAEGTLESLTEANITKHMNWHGLMICPQSANKIDGEYKYIPVSDSDGVSKYYLDTVAATKASLNHSHTKSQITDFTHTHTKSDITDFAHNHTKSQITDFAHTHDDRYYTESEVDAKLAQLDEEVGDLTDLTTTAKTNIVAAVNEVNGHIGDIQTFLTNY